VNEPAKLLRQVDPRMLAQLSVEELRAIVAEMAGQKLKRLSLTSPSGNCSSPQRPKAT
jgi:hypothetical protein